MKSKANKQTHKVLEQNRPAQHAFIQFTSTTAPNARSDASQYTVQSPSTPSTCHLPVTGSCSLILLTIPRQISRIWSGTGESQPPVSQVILFTQLQHGRNQEQTAWWLKTRPHQLNIDRLVRISGISTGAPDLRDHLTSCNDQLAVASNSL